MSKNIVVKCALCGAPVTIQPARLAELDSHKDLNFYCLLCGAQVAAALEAHGLGDHIRMFNPLDKT